MPCDSVTTYRATIEKAKNIGRLADVMKQAGWKVHSATETHITATSPDGLYVNVDRQGNRTVMQTQVSSYQRGSANQLVELTAQLTRGYVKETIKAGAKRFGWQAKEEESEKGQEKLSLLRTWG